LAGGSGRGDRNRHTAHRVDYALSALGRLITIPHRFFQGLAQEG
jgi:hypothetical protein